MDNESNKIARKTSRTMIDANIKSTQKTDAPTKEQSGKTQAATATRKGTVALFAILVLTAATGNLSQTALNTMLSNVVIDFGIGVDLGQWLTTIYMLSLGISVPLTGFLWKKISSRTYTILVLCLLLTGSIIDFITPWFWLMIVGRVMQATSAGFSMAVMQNVAMTGFASNKTATAMGIAGIAMGFAPNIGPTIGSIFVETIGWRWFFIVLAIVPVALMVATFAKVEKSSSPQGNIKLDLTSFVICAIGFGGILIGCSEASTSGIKSLMVWLPVALGVVFLVLFAKRQHKIQNPLIDLSIFEDSKFKAGFWMNNLLFGSFIGITLVMPLYIEGALGGTPADAGTALLPGAIAALIFNPLSGIVGDKIGKTKVMKIAVTILVIGSLLALTFNENSPIWYIALCQGVRGTGVSSSIGCTLAWLLEDLPREKVADGTSFSLVARQASASICTAVMVFIITYLTNIYAGSMIAYTCAFGFSALLAIAMMILVFFRTKK